MLLTSYWEGVVKSERLLDEGSDLSAEIRRITRL